MRIGFDFDNTIVNYDSLFHKVAVEQALVPPGTSRSKLAVRDYLRSIGGEEDWIVLQGYVYGARMDEADAYPGAIEFMRRARERGVTMYIVSHKTRHPFRGPQYDLHAAARQWVDHYLTESGAPLIVPDQVFFELTKEEKIARICDTACDYFVDDLPEILVMPGFPASTRAILFDPDATHPAQEGSVRVGSWLDIDAFFEHEWKSGR